jgi:fatty acid-binding protein DegV
MKWERHGMALQAIHKTYNRTWVLTISGKLSGQWECNIYCKETKRNVSVMASTIEGAIAIGEQYVNNRPRVEREAQ